MRIEQAIEGERIYIRSDTENDLAFVSDMWFDDEIGKYLSDPTSAYIDEAFQKALNGLASSPYGYYFIVESRESGQRIGSFCAFPNEDHPYMT